MSFTALFLLALFAATATELWLNLRQARTIKSHRGSVPTAFSEKISLSAHQKAADYSIARLNIGRIEIIYGTILLLGWTLGSGLQTLHNWVTEFGLDALQSGTLLIIAMMFFSSLLQLPFSIYRTFSLEARYGFNRTTIQTFIIDLIKGGVLSVFIAIPLIYFLLWLMEFAGGLWWIYAWAAVMLFGITLSWAFPTLIAPLFNKFTPLKQSELSAAINDLLDRSGFISKGIFVMDGSRRSNHGNAYFTGLGKNKRIVFFDTLIDSLSRDQIIAVLAHELGHFRHKHILKGLAISAVTTLTGFAILAWLMQQPTFYQALGVTSQSTSLALILFMFVTPLVSIYFNPLLSWHSRKNEYEADQYAAAQSSADDLISALVKLYEENASTLTPDPIHSLFYDSHPPALARIRHLEGLKN